MKKDVFVDKHKWLDVIKDWKQFLKTIKELESYLVEFEEDGTIKVKNYPSDCIIKGDECQLIIIITYNECTFLLNDGIYKTWTWISNIFLQPKGYG